MDIYLEQIIDANAKAKAKLIEVSDTYAAMQLEYKNELEAIDEMIAAEVEQKLQLLKENYEKELDALHSEIESKTEAHITALNREFNAVIEKDESRILKEVIQHE